jgi:hypothetical protein
MVAVYVPGQRRKILILEKRNTTVDFEMIDWSR